MLPLAGKERIKGGVVLYGTVAHSVLRHIEATFVANNTFSSCTIDTVQNINESILKEPVVVVRIDAPGSYTWSVSSACFHVRYVWMDDDDEAEHVVKMVVSHVEQGRAACDKAQTVLPLPKPQCFTSTRGAFNTSTFMSVVLDGLAPNGGLFMCKTIPSLFPTQLNHILCTPGLTYAECAQVIIGELVDRTLSPPTLCRLIHSAYAPERWCGLEDICPVTPLLVDDTLHLPRFQSDMAWIEHVLVMELYHGPTAAFKDFALQLFPKFFLEAQGWEHAEQAPTVRPPSYTILAATSGDTGVATISGFLNTTSSSRVMVLYPLHGVSPVQQLQMLSLDNGVQVRVVGATSDFDFCQQTVKTIFSNRELKRRLHEDVVPSMKLSSANSINWGRLIPQVVYYFWAYRRIVQRCGASGDARTPVDIVIPCGNFGNILSGYMAKRMGLPIRKLVVASNVNDVLHEFIQTGCYDVRQRALTQTASPSIDILKASNVERLLFLLCDGDTATVATLMMQLEQNKYFKITDKMRQRLSADFASGCCQEAECGAAIRDVFTASGRRRLLDPHTAVAVHVAKEYRMQRSSDEAVVPLIIASTAHWSKFPESVLSAIKGGFPKVSQPTASPAEAIARVRSLYNMMRQEGMESAGTEVHPALDAALVLAATEKREPRTVEATIAAVEDALWDMVNTSVN